MSHSSYKSFSPTALLHLPQRPPLKESNRQKLPKTKPRKSEQSKWNERFETRSEASRWGTKAPWQEASPSAIVSVRSVTMGRCHARWVPPPQPFWFRGRNALPLLYKTARSVVFRHSPSSIVSRHGYIQECFGHPLPRWVAYLRMCLLELFGYSFILIINVNGHRFRIFMYFFLLFRSRFSRCWGQYARK